MRERYLLQFDPTSQSFQLTQSAQPEQVLVALPESVALSNQETDQPEVLQFWNTVNLPLVLLMISMRTGSVHPLDLQTLQDSRVVQLEQVVPLLEGDQPQTAAVTNVEKLTQDGRKIFSFVKDNQVTLEI